MKYIEVLEKLGIIINAYFEYITPQHEGYYLIVDDFLFDNFINEMKTKYNIDSQQIYLAYRMLKCNFHDNPYIALAIAAYQVMVFYTLESNTSSDAYNEKLFSSKAYEGLYYQEYWYQYFSPYAPPEGQSFQERLWALIKKMFKIKNIPDNTCFGDRNRYVQYPKSQNLLGISMRTFRIGYANVFLEKGLEPNLGITYDLFEKKIFDRNQYSSNKFLRRLVFSFYNSWDGRSYEEIKNRTKNSTIEQEQRAKAEFLIKLQPEIQIYINRRLINYGTEKINDKYLWKFDDNRFLIRKGTVFIQDTDYKDWLPKYRKNVDEDDEILIITEQTFFPNYIKNLIDAGKIEIFKIWKYTLLLLTSFSREDFDLLGIPVKPLPSFSLIGGLKLKRNTYYDFALPSVKLNDTIKNKNFYKTVFVDEKEYAIQDGIAYINVELKTGRHCVKLLNSWDSSELYFNVEKCSNAELSDNHGWILNCSETKVLPISQDSEKYIDGLKNFADFQWIQRKITYESNDSLRLFLQLNEKLVNRFSKIGNIRLNKKIYD